MDAFKGKYERVSAENYEEFLKVQLLVQIIVEFTYLLMILGVGPQCKQFYKISKLGKL